MKNYLRVQMHTNEKLPSMDDVSEDAIKRLIDFGEQLAEQYDTALKRYAKELIDAKSKL